MVVLGVVVTVAGASGVTEPVEDGGLTGAVIALLFDPEASCRLTEITAQTRPSAVAAAASS